MRRLVRSAREELRTAGLIAERNGFTAPMASEKLAEGESIAASTANTSTGGQETFMFAASARLLSPRKVWRPISGSSTLDALQQIFVRGR